MKKLLIFIICFPLCVFAQTPPPAPASAQDVIDGTATYKFVSPYSLSQSGLAGGGAAVSNRVIAAVPANFYTNSTPHYLVGYARLGISGVGTMQCSVTNSANTRFFDYTEDALSVGATSNTIAFTVPPYGWYKFAGQTTVLTEGNQALFYYATNGAVTYATSAGTVTDGATQSGLAAGSYPLRHSAWLNKPSGLATNYSSLAAAKTASASGDVITATALNVGATNLLKNGVDYDFTGVTLTHSNQIPQSAGVALGQFDDRGQGALTNTVKGIKLIDFRSQVLQSVAAVSDTNPFVNLNAFGPIYITNPAANVRIDVDKITHSIIGNINGSAAIFVHDCTNTEFNVGEIIDPLWLTPDVYVGKDEFDGDLTSQSCGAGVYWHHGEMTVNVGTIKGFGYGFYANATGFAGTDPARHIIENYWMTADEIVSSGNAAIYTVGNTNKYRMWITAKEVRSIAGQAITLFGSQRFYLNAQKISTDGSTVAAISLGAVGSPEAWIVSEKVSCTNGNFVLMATGQTGTLDITAQHYEDVGIVGGAIGFRTLVGTNIIHGGRAKIGNGKGISHEGGRTFAENLYIDTATTTNTANNPVSVSAAGLILKDCILFAPAGAQCITAGSAQSVTILGTVMCNQTNSPNITFIGGGTLITNTAMIRL